MKLAVLLSLTRAPARVLGRRSSCLPLVVLLAAPVFTGCSGAASSEGDDESNGDGTDGTSNEGGSGGTNTPSPPPGACKVEDDALPEVRVWRLSPGQYANTLKDSFGYDLTGDKLPPDPAFGEGFAVFDTNHAGKQVTEQHFDVYRETAGAIASKLLPQVEQQHGCVVATADDACIESFVDDYGARAFRRPVEDEERGRYVDFFKASAGKWDAKAATRLVLEAMLQSPRHLYRTELGPDEAGDGERVALTQFEMASQLSYMLANSSPDQELMAAAAEGKLRDPRVVREHAERLVDSLAARGRVVDFFTQMLGVGGLIEGTVAKDPTAFPEFTSDVRNAMAKETQTFVEKVLFEEGGSLETLFNAKHSYVNKALAGIYKVSAASDAFQRVDLPTNRKGLFGHASVLASTSHSSSTSPASRGIRIMNKLLCRPIPSPPPGAADEAAGKVFSNEPNLTQLEHWKFAQENAKECATCHGQFVPLGLGLEHFDTIGRHRTQEFGKTIETQVTLKGYGDADGMFADTLDLISSVAANQAGQTCFVMQLGTYAFGHDLDSDQKCEVDNLTRRFRDEGLDVKKLLIELTQVDSFYNRKSGS
jgi:hypothetical protein